MKRVSFSWMCAVTALVLAIGSVAAQSAGDAANNSARKVEKAAPKKYSSPAASQSKAETILNDFCQCTEGKSEAAARIEKALASPLNPTGMDYADTPLKDVVDQLSTNYNIPIQLDKASLEEAGITTDERINVSLHNISLRSALRLVLKTLNATSIIQDEVLLITTKEAAEQQLKICVYDVRKIISDANDKNVESLVQTIKACVATDTWRENGGGQAEIRQLSGGLIVVTQTEAVHQQIHDLLATIQKMNRK